MKSVCISAQGLFSASSQRRRYKSFLSILSCCLCRFRCEFYPICALFEQHRGSQPGASTCCCFIDSAWGGEESKDGPNEAITTSASPEAPKTMGNLYFLPWIQGNTDEGFFSFFRYFQAVGLHLLHVSTCTTSNQTLTQRVSFGDLQNKGCFLLPCLMSNKCASTGRITRICLKLFVFLLLNITQLKLLWICIQSLAFLFLFHVP